MRRSRRAEANPRRSFAQHFEKQPFRSVPQNREAAAMTVSSEASAISISLADSATDAEHH
jgi:hypothetical protein